jgi:hypothetical protein
MSEDEKKEVNSGGNCNLSLENSTEKLLKETAVSEKPTDGNVF